MTFVTFSQSKFQQNQKLKIYINSEVMAKKDIANEQICCLKGKTLSQEN